MSPRENLHPTNRAAALQDAYLAEVRRQAVPVTVYLVNGFQLRGTVKGYDAFTILLEYELRVHLIYKHAVSTISPQAAFDSGLGLADDDAAPASQP
jgi:host factor-I protein